MKHYTQPVIYVDKFDLFDVLSVSNGDDMAGKDYVSGVVNPWGGSL